MSSLEFKAQDKVEREVRQLLESRFSNDFNFYPIVVRPCVDHDGERYLHMYIVFQGDQDKLDPAYTVTLPGRLWTMVNDLDYPGVPVLSFVEESEWPELAQALVDDPF